MKDLPAVLGESLAKSVARRQIRQADEVGAWLTSTARFWDWGNEPRNAGKRARTLVTHLHRRRSSWVVGRPKVRGTKRNLLVTMVVLRRAQHGAAEVRVEVVRWPGLYWTRHMLTISVHAWTRLLQAGVREPTALMDIARLATMEANESVNHRVGKVDILMDEPPPGVLPLMLHFARSKADQPFVLSTVVPVDLAVGGGGSARIARRIAQLPEGETLVLDRHGQPWMTSPARA
jgi:hypothetical protein